MARHGMLMRVLDTLWFDVHVFPLPPSNSDIMKTPKTDTGKISLPGELTVLRPTSIAQPSVVPKTTTATTSPHCIFRTVYDHGRPIAGHVWDDFDTVRQRVEEQWAAMPPVADVISVELKGKIERVKREQRERTEHMLAEVDREAEARQ